MTLHATNQSESHGLDPTLRVSVQGHDCTQVPAQDFQTNATGGLEGQEQAQICPLLDPQQLLTEPHRCPEGGL